MYCIIKTTVHSKKRDKKKCKSSKDYYDLGVDIANRILKCQLHSKWIEGEKLVILNSIEWWSHNLERSYCFLLWEKIAKDK